MEKLKIYAVFFCSVIVLFLCSCGFFEARDNRAKLADIRIGMTQNEVKKIMGEPPKGVFQSNKIIFYYTDPKWYDGYVTRDECTPFVFAQDEDRLVGFGYDYYRQNYSLPVFTKEQEKTDRDAMRDYLIENSKKQTPAQSATKKTENSELVNFQKSIRK